MNNIQIYRKELEIRLSAKSPKPKIKKLKLHAPAIREYWPGQGGFYAGIVCDIKTNQRWHLILAEGHSETTWGGYGQTCDGADSFTDGAQNTQHLLADGNEHPAAQWAASLEIDGHKDFYLPAQKELNLVYINLQDKCAPKYHWSSTQYSSNGAWVQTFEHGYQLFNYKGRTLAVRAVRRLPL